MKSKYLYGIGILLTFLIISTPFCFAQEMSLTYDANGNLVTGDGKYRTYNSLNQLWRVYNGSNTSILLEEYTYDPVEERVLVKKSYNTSGAWIETVVYVDQSFVQVKNNTGIFNFTYVYQDGTLVAQINPDGSKYFIHSDSKGSNTVITNSSGKVIENSSYSPFGEILSSGNNSRYGYEGKEYDSVVKDMDFHFRKYRADWGIFVTPDNQIDNVYDPQCLNPYSFERNNPYRNVDPDGHSLLSSITSSIKKVINTVVKNIINKVVNNGVNKVKQAITDSIKSTKDKITTPIINTIKSAQNINDKYKITDRIESFIGIKEAHDIAKGGASIILNTVDNRIVSDTQASDDAAQAGYGLCDLVIKDATVDASTAAGEGYDLFAKGYGVTTTHSVCGDVLWGISYDINYYSSYYSGDYEKIFKLSITNDDGKVQKTI